MMSRRSRLALFSLIAGGVALAGCASNPSSTTTTTSTHARSQTVTGSASTTATPRSGGNATTRSRAAASSSPSPTTSAPQAGSTGIPACDDYLASYVACHRTAAIYAPDQIEGHYEAMRDSLMRDSQDPNTRPQLSGRCTALAQTLRQALHGKACGPTSPATSSSASGTTR
ncbi:hypothetical protein [Dyella amyloliquefaciens]|uniref:hypothetical protein n=1 Tax=Dyella amyloliquefaciens TaxID=1770545 RepID=UPI001E2894E4|nr:hypothetical protein [Dyella amyloliquefaciens]